jgi:hypothetical protein
MLGFNGGLMGVRRTPTAGAASGLWLPNEQSVAKRDGIWPTVALTDPNFSSVSLLLHMDGSNGSTTFTDSSSAARTVTANGNAQISTAQSKFGGASALFDGNGDGLTVSDANDLDFGSGDFTIELWLNLNATSGLKSIATHGWTASGNLGSWLIAVNDGSIYFWASSNNSSWDIASGQLIKSSAATGTWYHIAVVRSGNNFYLFCDGVQTTTFSSSSALYNSSTNIGIGADRTGSGNSISAYIDELRITKGVARTIVVPTAPFPDS